jgi:hypothetical protein
MTTICNMSYKEIGPFAQTLFLGCSITSISQNLAWGTEASSCTVKLAKDTSSHPSDPQFNSVTTNISSIVNNTSPSNALVAGSSDNSKTVYKNVAIAEEKIESDRLTNDIANTSRVANKDTGKKCWNPHNLNNNPANWVGPDPGFVGDNVFVGGRLFGVAGVPCHARFDDLMFGGIINKWSSDSSIYTVEIEGPGNLLKGTQLIVNNYYGSISTTIGNTAGALPNGLPLAVPYADTTVNSFNGSILQGNIPNVINIFGYLQSQGFSSVIVSEQGINAAQIYDTLIFLLNNSNGRQSNQFSPYGAIVGKSLIEYGSNGAASIVAPQDITLTYGGSSINLTQLGFLNHKLAIDGIYRPLFRLDISQVPRPDDNIYWPSTNASISDFLDFCCSGAGGDWNVLLIPDLASSDFTGTIKVNFYNRNIQPPPKVIKNLVSSFGASDRVISYNAGEEYGSGENVRKMIVGGKQERIFQVMSNTLSKYRNVKVFDSATGTFMSVRNDLDKAFLETGNFRNVVRFPQLGSTRAFDSSFGGGLPYRTYGGAATAQVHNDFLTEEILGFSNTTVTKGSYETTAPVLKDASLPELPLPSWYTGSTSYPIHYDLISPYFGRGTNGSVRKVYYDRNLGQLQVNVNLQDIQPFFPIYDNGTFSGFITFYENEIRAAIAGFDSWISYVLEPIKLGMKTPTALLIYSFIRLKFGASIANDLILQGVGLLKTQSKTSALPTTPHTGDSISPGNYIPYTNALRPAFEKLHQFISSTLGSHYGKDFLVRLPSIQRRVDPNGVASYSYEISDSGWEEEGNFLDDTMQIGSSAATALSEENGKFGPLLGYNASAEWDRTIFQNINTNTNNGNFVPLGADGKSLLQMRSQFEQTSTDKWYFPLVHDLNPDQVVLMPHASYLLPGGVLRPGFSINNPTLTDSYNRSIPDNKKYKLYVKGNISDVVPENRTNTKILFANGAQYCVISAPGKIQYISSNSLETTLYEDLYLASSKGFELPTDFNSNLQINATSVSANKFLFLLCVLESFLNSGAIISTQGLNSEANTPIAAKCAIPCFAAIPIRDNIAVYGPWISHPGLIRSTIFPDRSETGANALTNNIVGGVELEISDSYSPWEYGGMDNLDAAILTKLADNNKYQQVLEAGSITLAGIMLRNTNIGSKFIDNNGPVINSIQIEMGDSGYKTTYHFRTYSRKLGLFNKEQSDNIQRFGKQALSNRKAIVENIRSQLSRAINLQDPAGDRAARLPKALSYSPVNVLVGAAYPMVHKNSTIDNAYAQLDFNPTWHLRPIVPNSISSNPKDMIRQQTVAQLYDSQELGQVIAGRPADYASRSIMSLDGIVSPISFYPTPYGYTYAITAYPRSKCPYCKGKGTYQYQLHSAAKEQLADDSDPSATSTTINNSFTTISNANCMFCVPDVDVDKLKKKSARPNEITPPFLIASGTDLQIISDRDTAFQYNSCAVNTYTLNPMVMSATGSDFSCYSNKQRSDRCGHSIDVVSFGNTSMSFQDGLRSSISNTINKNYNDYDTNLIAADPSNSQAFQNIRSFGLRGPLMLHSWGYDLEGYPVPNSSGEFKLNNQGAIVRDNKNNPVYKNQVLQADGSYSAPYKDNTFFKSWAQLPSTWPVGPIDLRWDDGAKVWTIGANYKPVWVVLETDLLNDTPVRGAVVESSYDNSPLPSGLRKLVFVKDTIGMFSAPRGAALYCRYDSQNGFYEPIYNRPLVTTGTIDGASLATIYKAYTPSSVSSDEVSSYSTSFKNPLGLDTNINSVGLFTFLNGSWILQSIRT